MKQQKFTWKTFGSLKYYASKRLQDKLNPQYKTPLARNLDEASQRLVAAKTRYAQSAVENLNADIQTKQKVLWMRVTRVDKELKVLSDLKAEKARMKLELKRPSELKLKS